MREQRNTGAVLSYPCMVKSWKDDRLYMHYQIMAMRPDVYCPVYSCGRLNGEWQLTMPLMHPHEEMSNPVTCHSALNKLQLLWGGNCGHSVSPAREPYQAFVERLEVPADLKNLCRHLYNEIKSVRGTIAADIHGDATIQNIVHSGDEAYWIDPSPREVPLEREMDLGKLLMSLMGYDKVTERMSQITWRMLYDNTNTATLTNYYCATHLARVWREQVDRREWILQVTNEMLEGV